MTKLLHRAMLFGIVAVALSAAETEKITIGLLDVRLGMTKTEVRSRVSEAYPPDLEFLWTNELVPIYDKFSKKLVGTLNFTNGKLTSVERPWQNASGEEAISIGKSIYALVSQLNESGQSMATVRTRTVRQPELTSEIVEISFGSKVIQIGISDGHILDNRI